MAELIALEEFKRRAKAGEKLDEQPIRKALTIEAKGWEESEDGLKGTFLISTATIDRDGDTINQAGWKLENYRKNPVVLWVHNGAMPPVAKSLAVWVENGLMATAQFTPRELNGFGHMIGQMYKNNFLRAASVGFMGLKWSWAENQDRMLGIDFQEQELLEWSCCPVPANPEALADAKAAGIDIQPMIDWAVQVLDGEGLWIPKDAAARILSDFKPNGIISTPQDPPGIKQADKDLLDSYLALVRANENE
jgi:hypothetical protein